MDFWGFLVFDNLKHSAFWTNLLRKVIDNMIGQCTAYLRWTGELWADCLRILSVCVCVPVCSRNTWRYVRCLSAICVSLNCTPGGGRRPTFSSQGTYVPPSLGRPNASSRRSYVLLLMFFSALEIFELRRPIAVKLSSIIGNMYTWILDVPKVGDSPAIKIGRKRAKLGAIADNFRLLYTKSYCKCK